MLKSAKQDFELEVELADRFGVDLEEFKIRSDEALTKLQKGDGTAYSYAQIAATGGPLKRDTLVPSKTAPKPMIRIQAKAKQDRNNPIQHAINERKFDLLLAMIRDFTDLADFSQLEIFVYWISKADWARTTVHYNLIYFVREQHEEKIELKPTYSLRVFKLMSRIFRKLYAS